MIRIPLGVTLGTCIALASASAAAQQRTNATADTLAACRSTLIDATYDSERARLSDWRMAEHVDAASYDGIKARFGPDAAIYGVPAGLDYAAWRDSLAQLKQADETSFTSREFLNVAWTALDGLAAGPYQACLEAAARLGAAGGIVLAPSAATQADVSLTVRYVPGGGGPDVLPVEWVGVDESARPPPPALAAGDQTVILPRPVREKTISVVGGGFTATVVLTPLPEARHEGPSVCAIAERPAPPPRLRPFDLATWVCPDIMPAGTYRVSAAVAAGADRADRPLRVAYRMALLVPVGGTTFAVDLPAGDGLADIDAGGGVPAMLRSEDQMISIPGGVVSFVLQVTGITDRGAPEGGPADDAAVLPSDVRLTLERLPD